jgi:hypothetical protein
MPTLNIEGHRVTVDDGFLKMSPDQQNATVEEISRSLPKKSAESSNLSDRFDAVNEGGVAKQAPQRSMMSPVTDIPSEIANAAGEGWDNIKGLANRGEQGPLEGLMTTARGVMGVPQVLMSPLTGAARSMLGHPIAAAETAIGGLIDPKTAALRDAYGTAYQDAKSSVDTAMAAAASRGVPVGAPVVSPPPSAGQSVVNAASRLSDVVGDVNVPRAVASDNMAVQRIGQGIRNIPVVGDAIPKAVAGLTDDLGRAVGAVADEYGAGSGPNVANRIGNRLQGAADAERAAAEEQARQSDSAALGDWERYQQARNAALDSQDATALQRAQAGVGNMSPQDMGDALITRLRQGEREARSNKERLYGVAADSDGSIDANAVRGLRGDVTRSLDESGLVIDPVLTPAAHRMVSELDNTPFIRMPGRGAPLEDTAAPRAMADSPKTSENAGVSQNAKAAGDADAPRSLLQFLAEKGGLGPDSELEAIGAHGHTINVDRLGRRKLVRQGGWPLDYAREAAEEAGYLQGDHKGTSTVTDLLDAIDAEIRGQKRYPQGHEGTVTKREGIARSEREQHEYDQHIRGIEDDLAAAGHGDLGADVKQRAIRLMSSEGMPADTAVEHALSQLEQEDNAVHASGFPGDRAAPPRSGAGIANGPAVDMQVLEQTRKRLNALSRAATNDADRRAARHVISAYDDWLGNAFDKALFSGSDEALQAYRSARAANADWRQRFGFNGRDDADRIINRMATGDVTPQEVSNWLVGASQVGAKGTSSRLLMRIAEATGNDPGAMQAIRGGVWNRLSQTSEGVTGKAPAKIADSISEFMNGSGRDVANRLFTPEQRGIMRAYADTLRSTAEGRRNLSEVAANTKPGSMEVGIGPMQELAADVLGRGGKTDEALFNAINSYAKSGGRGDVQALARIVRAIPEGDRGDLAGSIIRNLGVSPRTGQFSPDVFASQWQTYSPQAKAILFGNAGPHRQALDDIMTISQRLKEVGQRFGNPSGTAQNVNMAALAGGAFTAPLTTLATAVGGAVAARILAAPAAASSASKWTRAYAALQIRPTTHTIAAYQVASRNLANTAKSLGSSASPLDFMKALQGPVPSAAQDQQQTPRPPGQ